MIPNAPRAGGRRGITLVEILISIMILGIGLVSLATLFPIGLLRLREAQRQSRSAYLYESAAADVASRGLLKAYSFTYADLFNAPYTNNTRWYWSPSLNGGTGGYYDPLIYDRAAYLDANGNPLDPFDTTTPGATSTASGGYGLPFAYDPLWRYQTDYANGGIYLYDVNNPDYSTTPGITPEARFAAGEVFRNVYPADNDGYGAPSAYGLQRLTNFNRPTLMPAASLIPNIFVSPEDVVWQESANLNYRQAFTPPPPSPSSTPVGTPSPVVPDLSISLDNAGNHTYQPMTDWRFTWMLTAQQNNASNGASFDGNIIVFENRQFGLDAIQVKTALGSTTVYQATGENVYEGVFGYSKTVVKDNNYAYGYGAGADRAVLIRWDGSNPAQPDPVVKVGDWIADVTYERSQNIVGLRFQSFNGGGGVPNPLNNGEWDNLPAQRCFWYQVQKITPAQIDPLLGSPYKSMVVYVNRKLEARTLLYPSGTPNQGKPFYTNAVLVCPSVVNVIPQTFFVR